MSIQNAGECAAVAVSLLVITYAVGIKYLEKKRMTEQSKEIPYFVFY